MAICKLYIHLGLLAIFFQTIAWFCVNIAWSSSNTSWKLVLVSFAGQCIGLSCLYIWVLAQRPSRYYTILTLHVHLVLELIKKFTHYRRFRQFTKSWRNPRFYQERRLQEIIKENGKTIYGRHVNLSDIKSLDELRRRHPLTTYEHYQPYVERMMRGEENVLTKKTPTSFCRTTGTTGKPKYFPYSVRWNLWKDFFEDVDRLSTQAYPIKPLQKMLTFYVHPIVTETEHGAKLETFGTFNDTPDIFLGGVTTPAAGFKITQAFEANYIHLLFGLRETDIGVMRIGFLSFIEGLLAHLQKNWKDIVHDIEIGSLNSSLQLPDEIRSKLSSALGDGDPVRANQLRREFQKGFTGILRRVWPRLTVISAVDHAGIWTQVENTVAQGTFLMPIGFGSTEGFMALHLGPKYMARTDNVVLPTMYIAEFIRLQDVEQTQPRTYFLDEVEVDEYYEVVITQSWSGLYRYRLGDVIQITGFHDNCPTFRFMFRLGQILNLHYEKLNQKVVQESVETAVARWSGSGLVDYTVAESKLIPKKSADYDRSDVPYYLMFLELEGGNELSLTVEEKNMIDEELRLRNADYDRLRREGSISHPRIYPVRSGSFAALKEFIVSSGASPFQYKSPKKLRSLPMLELMMKQIAVK